MAIQPAWAIDNHVGPTGWIHLYLGVNLAFSKYTEPSIDISHKTTYFPGFIAKLAIDNPEILPFFAMAQYKNQSGTYNYYGYIQDLRGKRMTYSDSALPVSKQDFEFISGPIFGMVKLFSGIQYEHYTDRAYTTNDYFYKRERQSWYWIAGAGIRYKLEDYRIIDLTGKAKPLIWSRHDSHLSSLGGVWSNAPTIKQKQPHGFRFDLSAKYQYEMLWIEPYFSHTRIGATEFESFTFGSGFKAKIQEPANRTNEIGINIGIRF